jgi:carboxyl-terminal processing protease
MEQGSVRVIAPIDESPAAKAGIMVNDVITHIDGVPLQGLTIYQVVEKMRGAVKTNVRLAILRDGHDKPLELTAVRQNISMRSVRMCLVGDDIGYIRIAMLNDFTMSAFATGIIEWSYRIPQDQIKGYVLDLRNSPGGLRRCGFACGPTFARARVVEQGCVRVGPAALFSRLL